MIATTAQNPTSTTYTPPRSAPSLRLLLLVAGAAVLVGLVPFLSGLVGALILYTLTGAAHRRLSRRVPPRISAVLIVTGVFVLLLVPGGWLVSTILSEGAAAIRSWDPNDALAWLSRTPLGSFDLTKEMAGTATAVVGWISGHAGAVLGSVTSTVLNVVIALFGSYYLLIDDGRLWTRARRFLPVSEDTANLLASRFGEVTEALVVGTMLTAVMQGTLVGAGFAIVGFKLPILWGFVTGCVSVLPLLGSALVWLPGALVLLLDHRPGAAVFLLVLGGGIASNLDNLVRPFVYRRVSGIHPMLTLVGAFAGVRALGLIGAFVGPLALSYFLELLQVYDDTTIGDRVP